MPDQILHQSEFKRRIQREDGKVISTYRQGSGWAQNAAGEWVDPHTLVETWLEAPNVVHVKYEGARGFDEAAFEVRPVVSGNELKASQMASAGITVSLEQQDIGGGQKWAVVLEGLDPDTIDEIRFVATPAAVFHNARRAVIGGGALQVDFSDLTQHAVARSDEGSVHYGYELSVSGRTLTIKPKIKEFSTRYAWSNYFDENGRIVLDPTTVYVPEGSGTDAWRGHEQFDNSTWGWPGPTDQTAYDAAERTTISDEIGAVTQATHQDFSGSAGSGDVRTAHVIRFKIDSAAVAALRPKVIHDVDASWGTPTVNLLYLALGKPTAEEWETVDSTSDPNSGGVTPEITHSGERTEGLTAYIHEDGENVYVYILAASTGTAHCYSDSEYRHNLYYAEVEVEEGAAPDPAEVSTLAATDVTHESATLNGEVIDMGGQAEATVRFQYREQGAAEWTTTGGQLMTATGTFTESIAGLNARTTYEFEAIVDDVPAGDALTFQTAAASGGGTTPNAPQNLAAAATGQDSIQLTWDAPARGGPKVTGYRLERESPVGDGWVTIVANTGSTATSYLDEGLASATEFNYRAAAINANGHGDYSNADAATTEPPYAPGKPTNFAASYDSEIGDAGLSWDVPADDGGAAISGYRVTRIDADGLGTTIDTGSTSTSYLDEDLDPGTWTYSVQAVNSVGAGEASDPQTVVVASPEGDPGLLDPAVVKRGMTTPDDAALKSSLIRPGSGYVSGPPTAEQLRAGLLTEDGKKLKSGMLDSDGQLKPGLKR